VKIAREVRENQQKGKQKPSYNVNKTAEQLRKIMKSLEIKNFRIHTFKPLDAGDINYGIWIKIYK